MREYNCPFAGIDRCATLPPNVQTDRMLSCQECQELAAKATALALTADITTPGSYWMLANSDNHMVTRKQLAHGDAQVALLWAFRFGTAQGEWRVAA